MYVATILSVFLGFVGAWPRLLALAEWHREWRVERRRADLRMSIEEINIFLRNPTVMVAHAFKNIMLLLVFLFLGVIAASIEEKTKADMLTANFIFWCISILTGYLLGSCLRLTSDIRNHERVIARLESKLLELE